MSDARAVLAELAQVVASAAPEELPALAGRLREAELLVELRLRSLVTAAVDGTEAQDRNLSAREAARRLGVSLPYLYKHASEYPFTVRIGARVLFSSRGLEAWNRGQRPHLTPRSLEG